MIENLILGSKDNNTMKMPPAGFPLQVAVFYDFISSI